MNVEPLPTTADPSGTTAVTGRNEHRGLTLAYSFFVLIAVGRFGELIPGLASLQLAKVSMGVALLLVFRNWRELPRLPAAARPLTRTAMLLAALAVVTAPLSIWPGASVAFLYQQLPVLAAALLVTYKVAGNWSQLRKVGRVLIVSAAVLALAALAGFHGGRAESSQTYDTNDLAYLLVSVMPLAVAFVLNARTRANRMLNVGVLGVVIVASLLTASRGGFLGLLAALAMLVLLPIRRPQPKPQGGLRRQRLISTLAGVLCLGAVVWPFLPTETRTRLATVLTLESDYNMDTANEHSRSSIWERNFVAALHRPIGYGVDSFPMVDMRNGGRFMAPHNAYLQVLVELGFVGFLLFVRLYVLAWRMLKSVRQTLLSAPPTDERDQTLVFARMLQASLVGNAVAAFFLSMAYSTVLWTLLGVVIGCVSVALAGSAQVSQTQPRTDFG